MPLRPYAAREKPANFVSKAMFNLLLQMQPPLAEINRLWYALPLLVSVSLVYAATRHEDMGHILRHALSFGRWIVVFMVVIGAILQFFTWRL